MDANSIVATIARLSSSVSHHLTNWVGEVHPPSTFNLSAYTRPDINGMSPHARSTHRWGRHVGTDVTLVTPIVATFALLNSSGSHQTPETISEADPLIL
jgi:hypothetical protein